MFSYLAFLNLYRSLAASIKGGGRAAVRESLSLLDEMLPESRDFENLKNPESLVKSLKGGGKAVGGGIETHVITFF